MIPGARRLSVVPFLSPFCRCRTFVGISQYTRVLFDALLLESSHKTVSLTCCLPTTKLEKLLRYMIQLVFWCSAQVSLYPVSHLPTQNFRLHSVTLLSQGRRKDHQRHRHFERSRVAVYSWYTFQKLLVYYII